MIIESLKIGFSHLWKFKRIWIILYSLTLLLAIFVAYPFKNYLENKLGNSLMIGDMIKGINYTFYADFMNHYGDGIAPILDQSFYLVLIYLLLFVFLMGGIIKTFLNQHDKYHRGIFWGNNAEFFFRMFRLSFYFFLIHGLVLAFFIFIYLVIIQGGSINKLESEGIIFMAIKYMTPIYIFFASFFFMWHDYTKISLVNNDHKWIFQSMKDAIQFIFKNIKSTWGLYLLNMILLILIFIINYFITTAFEITSFGTIILSLILSQIFIISRLGMKLINLSSATYLYQKKRNIFSE